MLTAIRPIRAGTLFALAVIAVSAWTQATACPDDAPAPGATSCEIASIQAIAARLNDGDLVFIRIPVRPFLEVAAATGSWTNHVGIVIDTAGAEPRIAESKLPFSRVTTLSRFVARSQDGRMAVARVPTPLTPAQEQRLFAAAQRRLGVFYDTGFDLRSGRQFCSRYAREVLAEATGVQVGEIETFATLLARRPEANLGFWRLWFFGRIPWSRETVTPASLLRSPELRTVFDGVARNKPAR